MQVLRPVRQAQGRLSLRFAQDDKAGEVVVKAAETAGFSTALRFGRNDKLEEIGSGGNGKFEVGVGAGLPDAFLASEGNAGPSTSLRFAQDDKS